MTPQEFIIKIKNNFGEKERCQALVAGDIEDNIGFAKMIVDAFIWHLILIC